MGGRSPGMWLAIFCCAALTACGGGGGGGSKSGPPAATVTGNGLAPSTGPGDTASYFPSTTGDQWSFNYTTSDTTALSPFAIVGVAVNGTKTVQGVNATIFTRTDPTVASGGSDQYFYVNGGGVTLLGKNDATDSITPLIAPYVELLFPVQIGSVSSLSATNLPFGKDQNGNPITLNLTQSITNVAIESLDVPAGTFANAMHQTTNVAGTALDRGQSTPAVSGTDDTWLVPGIGQVKEQTAVRGGATLVSGAAELRGYTVNGKAHGLGTASAVTPNLVSANCLGGPTFFAPANVASDGTNFLAVALACDNSSGTVQVKWIATLIGPDGTVKTSVDLTSATDIPVQTNLGTHAVVAFDGTNYLIVHEDIYGTTSSPNLLSLLVSRSGSIVSGPNIVGAAFQSTFFPGDPEALAFDGSRYLLVYGDDNSLVRPPQMSGLFISPTTGLPDGAPFPISNTNDYVRDGPAVAFDGTNYLVVWGEFGLNPIGLRAMRVSTAGALVDSTPLLVMDASSLSDSSSGPSGICCDLSPSVTFDGTNYLVAYRDPRGAAPYSNRATVSAARVSSAGVLLDGTASMPGIVVASATDIVVDRVRSDFINGAHWLTWGSGAPSSLSASRVSPSGAVPAAWPNGFRLVPESAAGATAQWPAVAAAGANGGLVIWLQAQPNATSTTSLWSMPIYSPGP
jgi:hypothetical protein